MSTDFASGVLAVVALAFVANAASLDQRTTVPQSTAVDAGAAWTLLTSDDVRVIAVGDSFAVSRWNRMPQALLNELPGQTVVAASNGTMQNGTAFIRGRADTNEFEQVRGESSLSYRMLRSTPDNEFYTLPLRGVLEWFGSPDLVLGSGGRVGRVQLQNGRFDPAGVGLGIKSDPVLFRLITWTPSDPSLTFDTLTVQVAGQSFTFDPSTQARGLLHLGEDPNQQRTPIPSEINAAPQDLIFTPPANVSDQIDVRITPGPGFIGSNQYLHVAAAVATSLDPDTLERRPGLYYTPLADVSWSYSGFSSTVPGNGPTDKRMSLEQLVQWLDITTLDVDQPVVVLHYLAAERESPNRAAQVEAIVDRFDAAAALVGIQPVEHVLVLPHFHIITDSGGPTDRAAFESLREEMFEIAERRERVAAASIYDETDGMFFNGSAEAQTWLAGNGFDEFVYAGKMADLTDADNDSDLLDTGNLHPTSDDAAAFYADRLAAALARPIAPDVNHDGVLSIDDFSAFVAAFFADDFAADANFDGVLNIDDFSAFVTAFFD
ncbi:MAG: GC-type dockerin domain-anchored protein [Planctomycetota bacterium]